MHAQFNPLCTCLTFINQEPCQRFYGSVVERSRMACGHVFSDAVLRLGARPCPSMGPRLCRAAAPAAATGGLSAQPGDSAPLIYHCANEGSGAAGHACQVCHPPPIGLPPAPIGMPLSGFRLATHAMAVPTCCRLWCCAYIARGCLLSQHLPLEVSG